MKSLEKTIVDVGRLLLLRDSNIGNTCSSLQNKTKTINEKISTKYSTQLLHWDAPHTVIIHNTDRFSSTSTMVVYSTWGKMGTGMSIGFMPRETDASEFKLLLSSCIVVLESVNDRVFGYKQWSETSRVY